MEEEKPLPAVVKTGKDTGERHLEREKKKMEGGSHAA